MGHNIVGNMLIAGIATMANRVHAVIPGAAASANAGHSRWATTIKKPMPPMPTL
jgi:hypothetical protein